MSANDEVKKHQKCMEGVTTLLAENAIDVKGKDYLQVVHRVNLFRENYGLAYTIDTEILADDGTRVLMVAYIKDNDGRVIGKGHAEEIRNAGPVNRTSAVENCETSAIGRALANIGLAGNEYASAFEMGNIGNKEKAKASQEKAEKESVSKPPAPKEKIEEEPPQVYSIENSEGEISEIDRNMFSVVADILIEFMANRDIHQLRQYWSSNKQPLDDLEKHANKDYMRVLEAFKEKAKSLEEGSN